MLNDREDPRRHEARRPHDATCPCQLSNLDCRARAAHLHAAPGARGLDHVFACGTAPGVDQDLDEISLCHTSLLFPIRAILTPCCRSRCRAPTGSATARPAPVGDPAVP